MGSRIDSRFHVKERVKYVGFLETHIHRKINKFKFF